MPPKKAAKEANPAPRATRSRKQATASTDQPTSTDQPKSADQPKSQTQSDPPTRGRKRAVAPASDDTGVEPAQPNKKAKETQPETPELENPQIAKPGAKIPLDDSCPWTNYEVYIDGDGVIFDAALNQTNAGNNNNKFYRVQLLRNISGDYKTWTRWGRVGDHGQSLTLGDGDLTSAMLHFEKKFKDKSGLNWADRNAPPKPKKYTFVERSYAPDSDDEEEDAAGKVKSEGTDADLAAIDSKLPPAVQELMELVFNQQYFAATMSELNYDVAKLPLGKLSKNTITRGFQALKDLSALLNDPSLATTQYSTSYAEATENLSNSYFSLIPHAFGRNKPPISKYFPDVVSRAQQAGR